MPDSPTFTERHHLWECPGTGTLYWFDHRGAVWYVDEHVLAPQRTERVPLGYVVYLAARLHLLSGVPDVDARHVTGLMWCLLRERVAQDLDTAAERAAANARARRLAAAYPLLGRLVSIVTRLATCAGFRASYEQPLRDVVIAFGNHLRDAAPPTGADLEEQ